MAEVWGRQCFRASVGSGMCPWTGVFSPCSTLKSSPSWSVCAATHQTTCICQVTSLHYSSGANLPKQANAGGLQLCRTAVKEARAHKWADICVRQSGLRSKCPEELDFKASAAFGEVKFQDGKVISCDHITRDSYKGQQ